jgi:23S rRNA (uridine2552-2'-O)-methyltransferase
MAYDPRDFYYKKAKQEQYVARSVYKLQEIEQKANVFRRGQSVLDLGAAPGSWAQWISEKIGPKGTILGIDLKQIDLQLPNAHFEVGDIFETDFRALAEAHGIPVPFDAVVSDMAPATTGVRETDHARSAGLCEMALHVAIERELLRMGGFFIAKMFEGRDAQAFRHTLQQHFKSVKIVRPHATRKTSTEIFFIGIGRKA